MSIEFLVKMRDALAMASEACDDYLKTMAPKEEDKPKWDPSKVKWSTESGSKGPYEKAAPQATDDFKNMLADLKAHNGKLTRDGLFYWVFTDQACVGRKKA